MNRTFRLAAGLVGLALAVSATAAACSDDDASADGEGANADLISAISYLDNAGLHGIDDAINVDKEVPASAAATALKLQAVTALTEWPEELQDDADALEAIFADMAVKLSGDAPDLAVAGDVAKRAHDGQHDFSHDVWAHLQEEAGIEGSGEGHE